MQVKGSSIRSKLQFETETFGEEAERALRIHLREQGVVAVLEASWYPYDLYDGVLRWIAERHFGGDLTRLREVGRFSARHALTTTYEIYLKMGDFKAFLGRIANLHGRYYDQGKLDVTLIDDGHADIVLSGAPYYREPDIQVAAGFYAGAAEMMGGRSVDCRFEMKPGRVEVRIDWRAGQEAPRWTSGVA